MKFLFNFEDFWAAELTTEQHSITIIQSNPIHELEPWPHVSYQHSPPQLQLHPWDGIRNLLRRAPCFLEKPLLYERHRAVLVVDRYPHEGRVEHRINCSRH